MFCSMKKVQAENKFVKDQNIKIVNDVLYLIKKINSMKQQAIEIVGVPEKKNESCCEIAKQNASKLNVEIPGKNKKPNKNCRHIELKRN